MVEPTIDPTLRPASTQRSIRMSICGTFGVKPVASLEAARMARDLLSAVQNAHEAIIDGDGQGATRVDRRNRIAVGIEADEGGLVDDGWDDRRWWAMVPRNSVSCALPCSIEWKLRAAKKRSLR